MKKALLSVAIVLALAVAVQAHPVAVEPTSLLTATPGEVFVVHGIALNAPASDRVEGVNFEIYFDPTLVQVLGWNEGDFMAQQHPEMPWGFTTVDNSLGIVSLTLVRLGSKYSSGSGTGASVTFQYLGGGQAVMNYYLAFATQEGEISGEEYGEIVVGSEAIIPEPMTLALVGVALTALGVVARRRS